MASKKQDKESVTQSQPQESISTPTQEKSPSSERVFPPGMPQEMQDFLRRVGSKHKPMKPGEMRIWIPSDNPRVPKRKLKE